MYSVVLATVLATSSTAPATGGGFLFSGFHGCHSTYSSCCGCCGYATVSYGCWGGYGYPPLSSCCGYSSYSYSSCHGCCGGSFPYSGCYGCSGCTGCFGSAAWYMSGYPSWGAGCCCGGILYSPPMSYVPASYSVMPVESYGVPVAMRSATPSSTATLVVKAPLDVKVTVNGQLTNRKLEEQSFNTPALKPDQEYSYQVTAEAVRDGKVVTRTEKVAIHANRATRVDFSDLAVQAVAKVTVVAPEGAKILVDDTPVTVDAKNPTFDTPKLVQGKKYYYIVKAEVQKDGKMVTESRRVIVTAGDSVTVNFKEVNATQTVSR